MWLSPQSRAAPPMQVRARVRAAAFTGVSALGFGAGPRACAQLCEFLVRQIAPSSEGGKAERKARGSIRQRDEGCEWLGVRMSAPTTHFRRSHLSAYGCDSGSYSQM